MSHQHPQHVSGGSLALIIAIGLILGAMQLFA
jgi:hypothetical protein